MTERTKVDPFDQLFNWTNEQEERRAASSGRYAPFFRLQDGDNYILILSGREQNGVIPPIIPHQFYKVQPEYLGQDERGKPGAQYGKKVVYDPSDPFHPGFLKERADKGWSAPNENTNFMNNFRSYVFNLSLWLAVQKTKRGKPLSKNEKLYTQDKNFKLDDEFVGIQYMEYPQKGIREAIEQWVMEGRDEGERREPSSMIWVVTKLGREYAAEPYSSIDEFPPEDEDTGFPKGTVPAVQELAQRYEFKDLEELVDRDRYKAAPGELPEQYKVSTMGQNGNGTTATPQPTASATAPATDDDDDDDLFADLDV